MGSNSKVVKNYIYNTLYQALVLIAPLITMPYVSRILGADGIGIYSYAQSIATYFVLAGAVGTTLYGQREVAYVRNDVYKRSIVFWEIFVFRFVAVAVSSVIFLFLFGFGNEYDVVYRVLIIEIISTGFDISWFYMGIEDFKTTVVRNAVVKIIGIILVFIFVKDSSDIVIYTVCMTLPMFIGNISLWLNIRKYIIRINEDIFAGIKKHIKPIFMLFIPQIATEVYLVLDKTMIGLWASDIDQVGFYSQGQKIIKIVMLIITSLGTVMLPSMSLAFAEGRMDDIKKSLQKAFEFVFMIAMPLFFGVIAVAEHFVPVFFGPGYEPVVGLMRVIAPILIIVAVSNVIGKQFLLPTQKQKAYTLSVVGGAVVNVILNFIFIPKFDAMGASVATVISEVAVTGIQIYYARKYIDVKACFKPAFRYIVYGAVMGLAVYGIGKLLPAATLSICIMVMVGVVVYAAELIITKDNMVVAGVDLIKKKIKKK